MTSESGNTFPSHRNSITTRLILAFSVMLTLLFVVAAVAVQRLDALTGSMQHFVDDQARVSFLAQRANQHAQSAAVHLLRLLQTPERAERVPLYRAMDALLAESDAAVAALSRADLPDPDAREGILMLSALRARYGEAFQQTVELIEIEGLTPAREHFTQETDPLLEQLLTATLAVSELQHERMQSEVSRIEQDVARARLVVWIIAAVALVVGIGFALQIARSITRPIQRAVDVAESIAGGNYTCAVPEESGREIGKLMRALEVMRDSIAQRQKRILRLAYSDTLTGLPNRTRFLEVSAQAVQSGTGALVLLDINRFSAINNALGHEVGDRMLQAFAERLRRVVPERHEVARLGADEFAILIRNADRAAMVEVADGLLAQLRQPVTLDDQRLDVDVCLGIVLFPSDGSALDALMRRADLARSDAKLRHTGYGFGADVTDAPAHEQLALIGEMRHAMQHDHLVAWFQPKQALQSGHIIGVEALLRWQHPEKGLIAPGRFIPFAEQTGFIREITPWLLRHVVQQAAAWHRSGLPLVASVNLSMLDLACATLVDQVRQLLDTSGLPPAQLCLEITESALMDDPQQALRHLAQLSALGVKLSIDDYGSGQASLAYVQQLPVHELKIDRAFVAGVDRLPRNAAIVRSTILLCRELGLSVVAEGAETEAEIAWLRQNGCDIVQGYGIARPMPAAELISWISRETVAAAP